MSETEGTSEDGFPEVLGKVGTWQCIWGTAKDITCCRCCCCFFVAFSVALMKEKYADSHAVMMMMMAGKIKMFRNGLRCIFVVVFKYSWKRSPSLLPVSPMYSVLYTMFRKFPKCLRAGWNESTEVIDWLSSSFGNWWWFLFRSQVLNSFLNNFLIPGREVFVDFCIKLCLGKLP